jgi:preprotein translocase subunit SecA
MKQIFTGLFLEPEEFDFSLLTKEFPSLDWKEKKEDISLDYSQLGKPNVLRQDIENLPYSLEQTPKSFQVLYQYIYDNLFEQWKQENIQVKELGGLFVLGTERSETRRIDNQLRGRAGRQGDPGVSQFCVSLEDDLMKVFGGESIRKWVEYLMSDEDLPLESDMLTKSLENAQKKLELYNYDIRKNVFQYDNILNSQRKQLFQARKRILCEINSSNLFLCYLESNWEKIEPAEGRVNFFPDFYDQRQYVDAHRRADHLYSGQYYRPL